VRALNAHYGILTAGRGYNRDTGRFHERVLIDFEKPMRLHGSGRTFGAAALRGKFFRLRMYIRTLPYGPVKF
jgi:hypothetical protein